MNRIMLFLLVITGIPSFSLYGQDDADVFESAAYDYNAEAYDLNESKDYLRAYRSITLAEQSVDRALSNKFLRPSQLDDNTFRYPYWAIKKSKAEIAYMLGAYTDMEAISDELQQAISDKTWEANDEKEAIVNGLRADLAKIDGSRYFLTEKYDSSEVALKRALQLGGFYGNDYFISRVHDDLAQLYYKQKLYDKALMHLDSILASPMCKEETRNKETLQNIRLVESQRALCLAQLGRYKEALDAIEPVCRHFKKNGDKRQYAESLRKKGKILMLQYDATGEYNSVAKSCYQEYLSISKDFIDDNFVNMNESQREQYWMTEQPFVTDCFRLEDKAPELLYDVALYGKAVLLHMGREFKDVMSLNERKKVLASIRVNWRQVRDKLPESACAIEFMVYEKKGENHIGGVVIEGKSLSPKFIDLGTVSALSDYRLYNGLKVKDVFADTQSKDKINTLYNDTTLRRMIWTDAMVDAIGECELVLFSPDGILHQLGIEYMNPPSLDGKAFYRLTTTRLLTQKKRPLHTDRMLVCGGVEYGLSEEDSEFGNDELAYSMLAPMHLNIAPLPNSHAEIDSIRALRGNKHNDRVLRADSLTENALIQLMGKYNIVHISTHGLFSEVARLGTDIRPSSTDTQLSRSCLFLSGSEKNLRQEDFDACRHDGILSARELSKMDLNDVDLTVMSACMSGLGYITPDGVYGLQRGLKTAGVNAIISTLWSVDDEATCFFIIQLYKNMEKGHTLHEAFRSAREALKKYEKTYGSSSSADEATGSFTKRRRFTLPKFNKPYFYNAFILIDGLE